MLYNTYTHMSLSIVEKKGPINIRHRDWFYNVMDIYEHQWNFADLPKKEIDVKKMGKFRQISIGDLYELFEKLKKSGKISENINEESGEVCNAKFIFRIRIDDRVSNKLFDTSALQTRHGFKRPLYQVASNFNCAEAPSQLNNIFNGNYATKLTSDSTQGPSAAGGAGHGAIERLRIHKEKEIDLLDGTPLDVAKNGKLYKEEYEGIIDESKIKIGLHINVAACFDRSEMGQCIQDDNGPIIDQVFTSTYIMEGRKKPTKEQYDLMRILLTASYIGTYLAAICRQSERVVLTLIGGGAFNNPIELIIEVLATVHNKFSKYLPKKCVVELPIYVVGEHQYERDLLTKFGLNYTLEKISSKSKN